MSVTGSPRSESVLVGFDSKGDGFPFSDRVGLLGRNTSQGGAFRDVDMRIEGAFSFNLHERHGFGCTCSVHFS